MNKRLFLFVAMAFVAAVGLERNAFSAGAVVEKIDESFPFVDNVFSNPCGGSDITASGVTTEKGTVISFPDGSENVAIRESTTGSGTDGEGNTYQIGGFEIEHESRTGSGEVSVMKFTSSTGQSFVNISKGLDLKNNTVEKDKSVCLGN